jgi:hypothetical protein
LAHGLPWVGLDPKVRRGVKRAPTPQLAQPNSGSASPRTQARGVQCTLGHFRSVLWPFRRPAGEQCLGPG